MGSKIYFSLPLFRTVDEPPLVHHQKFFGLTCSLPIRCSLGIEILICPDNSLNFDYASTFVLKQPRMLCLHQKICVENGFRA